MRTLAHYSQVLGHDKPHSTVDASLVGGASANTLDHFAGNLVDIINSVSI